jgi:hypothetical protein
MIIAPFVYQHYSMMVLNNACFKQHRRTRLTVMLGMGGQLSFAAVPSLASAPLRSAT